MSLSSFTKDSANKINWSFDKILNGEAGLYLVESGVSVFIDQNRISEIKPKNRAIVSMNPTASILIKKKAFSTFKATNDLRWMDKTEKMLLRATKALFALKVAQLRAYESLTKLDNFYEETGDLNFALLADLISSSKYMKTTNSSQTTDFLSILGSFGVAAGMAVSVEDVIKIVRRNAFSTSNTKTTWIVDPDDIQNYGTGPGTGVIELCTFTNINTSVGVDSGSKTASFSVIDPHRIMNIIEDDVETAIEESLYGTLGLLNDLAYAGMGGEYIDPTLIVSSAFEVFGLGNFDPTIDVDYIRDRLRTFYLGKWMINVNDGIHIFIAGNKSVTNNSDINSDSFGTALDDSYFKIDDVILEAERKLYTNQNISSSSYKNIRKYSNNSFIMQHVFGGYVKSLSENYSAEKSTLSVTCQDNMGWLTEVRFMEEPALMDPRAPLEDPLTPYDIKTISSSTKYRSSQLDLLPENKILLKSGLLSFGSGLLTGVNANETNIYQGQYSGPGSMYGAQIVQHPSGLIYRWRSGVLAVTSTFSPTGDNASVASSLSPSSRQNYGFAVTNSVVANLDVANVISVLVTGQPYNMETFTRLAAEAMNVVRVGNSMSPNDALSFTLDSIRKQNPFYGNFKPFRLITMSDRTINRLSGDSFTFEDAKSKVSILRKRKNEINKKIRILKNSGSDDIISMLEQERKSIELSIGDQIGATYKNNGVFGGNGINAEALLDANFNIFGQNKALKLNGNEESDHDLTRAMMKIATTRRIEDVKLNRDQNLLIVSDQYDLNPDIKAYLLNLKTSGFQLFKGTYLDVYERCKTAASVTMMEFFCNSQGHLEIRPPQYNKTPLSVLSALSKYQSTTGRKIVPDFLFTMLTDRISSIKLELHSLNLRIAIIAMMMGRFPDSSLIPGVPVVGKSSLAFFGISTGLTGDAASANSKDPSSINLNGGSVLVSDTHSNYFYLDIGSTEDGDILDGDITTSIGNFDELVREFGTTSGGASNSTIYDKTLESLINPNKNNISTNSSSGSDNQGGTGSSWKTVGTATDIAAGINLIISAFRQQSGINPVAGIPTSGANGEFIASDLLVGISNDKYNTGIVEQNLDKLFEDLEQSISKRNSLIVVLKKDQDKESELSSIESDISDGFSEENTNFWEDPDVQDRVDNIFQDSAGSKTTASKLAGAVYDVGKYTKRTIDATRDFLSGSATKGSLFDHLIDDDTRNLLGPGSGKRFIIYDEQIKSYEISERAPEVTRIDIFGSTPIIDQQMKQTTGGENLTLWAGAVDYDLWRQYGYKHKPINDAPFISDAETQAKPLALQHLAIQRTSIFSGSIQVAGNEYYQPGDTVYVPSKGLLFYVSSVGQRFSIGSSFDTDLSVIYGHPPGAYLPTPMDVIGQSYSKDTFKQGSYFVKRKIIGDDNYHPLQPDCTLTFPKSPQITKDNVEYLLSHKNNMVKFYNMVTDISNGLLTSGRILLIRGFVNDSTSESEITEIKEKLSIVSGLFQNPVILSQKLNSALGDDLAADFLQPSQAVFNINAGSGMNKELNTMFLPNSLPVTKVSKEQILLQVVNLKRGEEDGSTVVVPTFKCFSPIDLKKIGSISKSGSATDVVSSEITDFDTLTTKFYDSLPKDGPSQTTWLEMDDLIQNIVSAISGDYEKVIEIGILDMDSSKVRLLMSLK